MNKNNAYFDAAGKEDLFMGRYYQLTKSISDQAKEDALNELRARGNVKVAEITEDGKYLLVACRDSNVIEVFRRDITTGKLTNTHNDIKLGKPVCIQFADK